MFPSHGVRQAQNRCMCIGYERAVPLAHAPRSTSAYTPSYPTLTYRLYRHETINSSASRRKLRRKDPNHVPRPRNAFIIFRMEYVASMYVHIGENQQNELSKHAAHAWAMMTEEEKLPYRVRAWKEMDEHKRKHPEFNYSSKRKAFKPSLPSESTMWTWSNPSNPSPSPLLMPSEFDYKCGLSPGFDSSNFAPDPPAFHQTFSTNINTFHHPEIPPCVDYDQTYFNLLPDSRPLSVPADNEQEPSEVSDIFSDTMSFGNYDSLLDLSTSLQDSLFSNFEDNDPSFFSLDKSIYLPEESVSESHTQCTAPPNSAPLYVPVANGQETSLSKIFLTTTDTLNDESSLQLATSSQDSVCPPNSPPYHVAAADGQETFLSDIFLTMPSNFDF